MSFEVQEVARALRFLREHRQLTQVDCQRMSGITKQMIGSWERGERLPLMASLRRHFETLECDFRDLQEAIETLRAIEAIRQGTRLPECGHHPKVFGDWQE